MAVEEPCVRLGEWLTIVAVLIGPILAIQAQKWLERRQAKRAMKEGIFRTLMATRATPLAPDHVQALNMIDVAFYGYRFMKRQRQSDAEQGVIRARRSYFDTLNTDLGAAPTDAQQQQWIAARGDHFYDLLESIAKALNFDFDRTELRRAVYAPRGHDTVESEQKAIRVGLAAWLQGDRTVSVKATCSTEQSRD